MSRGYYRGGHYSSRGGYRGGSGFARGRGGYSGGGYRGGYSQQQDYYYDNNNQAPNNGSAGVYEDWRGHGGHQPYQRPPREVMGVSQPTSGSQSPANAPANSPAKEEDVISKTREMFSSRRNVRRPDNSRKVKREVKKEDVSQSHEEDREVDDEDEDVIKVNKRSVKHSATEEDETDHEDDIPKPSTKSKKLHRLLRRVSSDEDEDEDEEEDEFEDEQDDNHKEQHKVGVKQPKKKPTKTLRDASGRTPLQKACKKGDYDLVSKLIASGADVNDADFAGVTPLHEAALKGYLKIITLLLDNGANINAQTGEYDKDTALLDASSNLNVDCVKLLLARGANPMMVNVQGDTALDVLADDDDLEDDEDLMKVKELRKIIGKAIKEFKSKHDTDDEGNDDDDDDDEKKHQSTSFYDLVTLEGKKEIYERVAANDVNYVLQYFSNLDKKCPKDLLIVACKYGYGELVSILIAFNADVNYSDKNGWTSLMHSVGKAHKDVVNLLLVNKANANAVDKNGKTALDILNDSELFDEDEAKLLRDSMIQKKRKSPSSTDVTKASEQPAKKPKREESAPPTVPQTQSTVAPVAAPELKLEKSNTPTPEEIEAQRLRDIEAQKSREYLEQQRLERKKLKELEIARKIEALEQEREAEKQAVIELELAKKREEELAKQRILDEENKKKRLQIHKFEMEKRKFIRSYYPFGLQLATFDGPNVENAQSYKPYYSFNQSLMLDLQICLLFGTEELYTQFPEFNASKKLLTMLEKDSVWNLMWPVIGSYNRRKFESTDDLIKVYGEEKLKFRELQIHWIPTELVREVASKTPQLSTISPILGQMEEISLQKFSNGTAPVKNEDFSTDEIPQGTTNPFKPLAPITTPLW